LLFSHWPDYRLSGFLSSLQSNSIFNKSQLRFALGINKLLTELLLFPYKLRNDTSGILRLGINMTHLLMIMIMGIKLLDIGLFANKIIKLEAGGYK